MRRDADIVLTKGFGERVLRLAEGAVVAVQAQDVHHPVSERALLPLGIVCAHKRHVRLRVLRHSEDQGRQRRAQRLKERVQRGDGQVLFVDVQQRVVGGLCRVLPRGHAVVEVDNPRQVWLKCPVVVRALNLVLRVLASAYRR